MLARRQSGKRGWLTYTELVQLLPSFAIAKQIINYSTILALSYVAGVMTIVGGFFVASHVPGTSLSSSSGSKTSETSIPSSPSRVLRPSQDLSNDTNRETSDLSEETETELDYIMDDLNESIEMYDDDLDCSTTNVTTTGQMFGHLNLLLQTKCSPTSAVNNGILLRNYLDDNGVQAMAKKNHTNWSWITELLVKSLSQYNEAQNHDKDTFDTARLFPAMWLKFI